MTTEVQGLLHVVKHTTTVTAVEPLPVEALGYDI